MQYTTIFTQEPEGGYTVEVLELPGCVSYGENIEEAREMVQDAIKAYISSQRKHGEYIPVEEKTRFISSVSVYETV
ncbi:antitoxin HicB [Candidatus Gracilibacteria bacterium CG2_30_37_12]|nr:MAG: antitoxin HicB [Candidatus Gracilibacteria bacterium CG2_30_37_12]